MKDTGVFKKGDVLLNTVPEKICMSGLISRFERQVVTCADCGMRRRLLVLRAIGCVVRVVWCIRG